MMQFWYRIKNWVETNVTVSHSKVVREAMCGSPFDWSDLLELEKVKLEEMYNHFGKSWHVDHKHHMKWIKICIDLLDIMINEPEVDPSRINTNNCMRFSTRHKCPDTDVIAYYKRWPNDLRYLKAKNLYYEIRKEHTDEWWD